MVDATKWTLIQRAAGGDKAARSEFTTSYLPAVRAYLRARWSKRLPPDAMEDAIQEVFVECLKEHGVLERAQRERMGGFRSLLYGVVKNVALREEARRASRKDSPSDHTFHGDELVADEASFTQAFDRAWARTVMSEARALQEARARETGADATQRVELLRLRFHEGTPIRDIARLWQVEAAHLHSEYRRAIREFEQAFRDIVAVQNPGPEASVNHACRELLAMLA